MMAAPRPMVFEDAVPICQLSSGGFLRFTCRLHPATPPMNEAAIRMHLRDRDGLNADSINAQLAWAAYYGGRRSVR